MSVAMKVRSSRVAISTRSTPRRRRLMSRQIEINDWIGDSKLTHSDVVAEAKDGGGGDAGVEGHDGGAGRQGRREGGAGKSYKIYALHIKTQNMKRVIGCMNPASQLLNASSRNLTYSLQT